jgi:hypothetical protein
LFFARSNLRAKADTHARLHQVYYGDWEHRVAGKILARKFLFCGSSQPNRPSCGNRDRSPTLSACLAVYFSPDPDLIESALTIPTQSRLFVQS